MQTRSSQNSVLGKRTHQVDGGPTQLSSVVENCTSSQCPLTPEVTPKSKRARMSDVLVDGNSNKENIPPFRCDSSGDVSPTTPSPARSLRRTNTVVSPQCTRLVSVLSTPPPTPSDSHLPIHTRARALLRATCNSTTAIAGRAAERDIIVNFIEGAKSASCDDSQSSTLFISGSPGTGKTALVNSVLADFEVHCGDLQVVSVNCMTFQNVDTLWQRVCESLIPSEHGARNGTLKGRRFLDELFASRQKRCLLILDELDHIASSMTTLSDIFSLSHKYRSIIRIIGIANTHTLTSTSLSSNEAVDVHTLHFRAYTSTQLLEVLRVRLAPLYANELSSKSEEQVEKLLPTGTLTLLCKKVASQTGDVRTLFEVLRGAIDIAVSCGHKEGNPLVATPVVTPTQVLSALKAYMPANGVTRCNTTPSDSSSYNSEVVTKIRNLGLQARLVLLSAVLASKRIDAALPLTSPSSSTKTPVNRTGSASLPSRMSGFELAQLHAYYSTILVRAGNEAFAPVSRSEFSDVISVLETCGLVSSSTSLEGVASPSKSGRRGFGRSLSFGGSSKCAAAGRDIKVMDDLRVDEILRGLGISGTSTQTPDPLEEEVAAIWVRESARIAKDVKMGSRAAGELGHSLDDPFDDAFEC
ncbi:P-loop containing nucleoside triphosphate hydrolase protein [Phlebopus sp. FC_14]|nr:P-loop containing nucleoside triphosphate hydrolase protein [Phlebopus sp. FC_14]